MTTLYDTLALDYDRLAPTKFWDLTLDNGNNIGTQPGSYAIAQDVASALQTYLGEVWFDTTVGLPYFTQVLNGPTNVPLIASLFNRAAKTVPNVVDAQSTLAGITSSRKLTGVVKVIDTTGQSMNAHF